MAINHALSGELTSVLPLGAQLPDSRTFALFKAEDLEVIRLVLLAGKSLPPHKVPGEITIHRLEGSLDVQLENKAVRLVAGELMFLAGDATHGVKAIADATALVSIALKP